jgi:surfeit locus 1 family protein
MWSVARRPRWIAALLLALLIAAAFAALSQWQLARSVATGTVVSPHTEASVPLETIAKPQTAVTDTANARIVSVTGTWTDDYELLSDRLNRGTAGWWVVGHLAVQQSNGNDAGLAVAIGWAPTKAKAVSAQNAFADQTSPAQAVRLTGRYLVSEAAEDSDVQHGKLTTLSTAQLVNVWKTQNTAGVYAGYLVDAGSASGLTTIDSPKPTSEVELNWLNLFYAAEWVVFAGFAIFLWYRLVRDAWEREQEEASAETADVN